MGAHKAQPRLDSEQAASRVSAIPAVLVVIISLLIPLFDTTGIGPVVLSVGAIGVTLLLPRAHSSPVSVPVTIVYFAVVLLAAYVGSGHRNLFYDASILLLLAPSAYLFGYRVALDGRVLIKTLRAFVVVVTVAAVFGFAEMLTERYLFTNSLFSVTPSRDGQFRGRAFFPQSLVLAVFCSAAIPIAVSQKVFRRFDSRVLITVMLLGGVFASGSRGVVACIGVCLCLVLIYRGRSSVRLKYFLCACVVLFGFVVLLVLAGNPFSGSQTSLVTSTDGATASAQYRAELYRQIVPVLFESPVGTGLGKVPDGIITFRSSYGTLDASRTVDSEIVLILLKFGAAGGILYVVLWWACIRWLVLTRREYVQSLVVFLFAGVFLALQSWLSIVFTISMLVGVCASSNKRMDDTSWDSSEI